jgi:hypothetical protein
MSWEDKLFLNQDETVSEVAGVLQPHFSSIKSFFDLLTVEMPWTVKEGYHISFVIH